MNYTKGVYYEEIKKPDITSKVKKTSSAPVETRTETVVTGMNFDAFKEVSIPLDSQQETTKQTRRKSSSNNAVNTTGLVTTDGNKQESWYSATEPYMNKYAETNGLLKTAIAQIDVGLGEMQGDMMMLRNNKTMRNKYQSMSMIQKNMGDYLGNKINAIKELNNIISKCNDLELKRAKELKELDAQDDDKRIMDLYNAMISMPVGGQSGMMGGFSTPLGPNTFEMTYAGNPNNPTPNIVTSIEGQSQSDIGYANYLMNKTPAQNMMSIDTNPNIQQVVVHNRATGQSYFEIMDMSTMRPVPNTDKYDNSFLEDTHMDFINNIATNVNIGESYPIVQIGGDPILNEY
jgi:hypothetical protein